MVCVWRAEDSLQELILVFHHVGLMARTQAVKLGGTSAFPL